MTFYPFQRGPAARRPNESSGKAPDNASSAPPDDTRGDGAGVRVFVSYSHDSAAHKSRVFGLTERLRDGGIDADVDAYHESPPEGWPRWMATQVRDARYVLVVCTAAYHRRVMGREADGVGLGARWEGSLITQAIYEQGGRNDKFIPVVFSTADVREIPDFLRNATRYELTGDEGYQALYRRLTGQPRVVKRPLGRVEPLPPDAAPATPPFTARPAQSDRVPADERGSASARSLFLVMPSGERPYFLSLVSVDEGETVTAVLSATGEERAFLERIVVQRGGGVTVGVAFGLTAFAARITRASRAYAGGEERFTVTLTRDGDNTRSSIYEAGTPGFSADDIARLRAQRILLDDARFPTRPRPAGRTVDHMAAHSSRAWYAASAYR
jgi:SEFIR domain